MIEIDFHGLSTQDMLQGLMCGGFSPGMESMILERGGWVSGHRGISGFTTRGRESVLGRGSSMYAIPILLFAETTQPC